MVEFRSETQEINGYPLRIRRGGEGPPLLYLHGAGGAGPVLPFMEQLAARHEVIVPEHPGFGGEDAPDWLDDIQDMGLFYLDALKALKLDNVHLVGNSLGGWIALEMAVFSTERIASLTLVGAAGIDLAGVERRDIFLMEQDDVFRLGFHDTGLAEKLLAAAPQDPEAVKTRIMNWTMVARLAWHPRWYDPKLEKWLHRIDVPTHVIWAKEDRILPVDYADAYVERIAGARKTVVGNCGHLIHVEKPDEFAAAVTTFTQELAA